MRPPRARDAALSEVGVLLQTWLEAFSTLRRPQLLGCLVPWLAAEGLWVAALARFPRPPLDVWLAPLFEFVGTAEALHYPSSYLALPRVERIGGIVIALAIGSWSVAALVRALPRAFAGTRIHVREALGATVPSLPSVWLVALPRAAFVILATALSLREGADAFGLGGLVPIAGFCAAILVDLALAYGVVAVVAGRCSVAEAIRRSIVLLGRFPWATLGFVLAPRALFLPFWYVERDLSEYFGLLAPESSWIVVAAGAFAVLLAAYLETATCTRLYLHAFGEGETAS